MYFGSSEFYVRVMGLVGFLLHCYACNASSLVLEILKTDKIWGGGQFALASLTPNSGDSSQVSHRDLHPWFSLLKKLTQAEHIVRGACRHACREG